MGEILLVHGMALRAHQNNRLLMRLMGAITMLIVFMLTIVATHNIAIHRRHFVQYALLYPKIQGTVSRGRRHSSAGSGL